MKNRLIICLLFLISVCYSQTNCTSFNPANFVFNGNAVVTNSPEVTLTIDQGNLFGTMWSNQEILFNEDFLIESELFFGLNDWGADGIAFVLQPQSSNAGGLGGGIGYAGISPSIAIEFDTYYNSGSDPLTNDHVAIVKDGQPFLLGPHSEFITPIDIGNVENGQWHTATFQWTASTQKLKLIFDGVQLFDVTINLGAIFPSNNSVFWGFTSATGGANNLHKVKINNYCVTLESNVVEICVDGLDNDNDGFIDGFDSDCPCVDNTYFNICQPDCQINFTPEPLSIIQNWATDTPIITMSSIVSGDINNDGMPEIVALGTTGMTVNNPRITSGINIFNGSNGSLISTITTPYTYWEAPGSILIADVNNDGFGEIIFASSTSGNNAINQRYLFCYDINGNLIWKSNVQYGTNTPGNNKGGGTLGIADFNFDGIPEVYIFNEIFNAQTGIKLIDGGGNGIGRMETTLNNLLNGVYSLTVAADLTNNTGLELAAGKTVYNVTITNINGTSGNSMSPINNPLNRDGFTSIADINLDGLLDVIVSTSGNSSSSLLYIWNPNTNNIISSINLPSGANLDLVGVPFIGDMDSDGTPEIGVCRPYKLLTYKFVNNNLVLKWELITTDYSGATKISMFDFNQDGIQEIIYRDETQLRIINGSGTTPIVLSNFPSLSGTALEGPIICDINNDNQTNILITSDDTSLGPFKGRIQSFKSNGQPWAPSRKIWNQYAYFNVNINDDLSVPVQQQNHGLQFYNSLGNCLGATLRPLNSFMTQETIRDISGCPIYPAPDLIISQVDNIVYDCNNQITSFDLTIENQGSTTVSTEFNIMIFEGNNTNPGSLVNNEMVNISIAPSTQTTVTIELSDLSLTNVFALLNFNNSNQVFPYNSVNECDYSNNFFNFSLVLQLITPTFTQVAPICSGTNLAALPTTSNNGYTGTWSPALNNTATTTYTFTPNSGQCASSQTMTITVEPPSILYITNNDPNCNPSALSWSTLNSINPNTASASIDTNLITINKPTGGLFSTSNVYSGNIFPSQYNLPINSLTLANNESGLFTFCFNTPVQNPQIAIASIGRPGLSVPINTSVPYQVIWAGPGMNFINNQSLVGEEGYCIIVFPGTHQCISFDYLVSENYCNIVFGTQDSNCQIDPICMGGSVELVPHGSTNITWSPINDLTFLPNSNHVIASPSQTTTYTITSNDLCQNQASITVTVNPNITPTFSSIANICSGATLSALPTTSNNGITGTWSPALNNTATTTYTFTPNSGQCATNQTMTITVDPLITPTFNQIARICTGTILSALPTNSTNGISGTWTPELNNNITTTYTFTPDSNQCASNFEMIIEVFDINTYPIPKGISPNGDGKNENWDLISLDVITLKLYNRYGQLVYEKENYTNEWFGQNKTSQSLPDGTYFYVLDLKCGTKTGWVYIIK